MFCATSFMQQYSHLGFGRRSGRQMEPWTWGEHPLRWRLRRHSVRTPFCRMTRVACVCTGTTTRCTPIATCVTASTKRSGCTELISWRYDTRILILFRLLPSRVAPPDFPSPFGPIFCILRSPLSWQFHPQHPSPIVFPPYMSKPSQCCLSCVRSKQSHLRCPTNVFNPDLVHSCHSYDAQQNSVLQHTGSDQTWFIVDELM